MRKLFIPLIILVSFTYSCKKTSSGKGSSSKGGSITPDIITKTDNQKWIPKTPFGMVPVSKGSFQIGQSDQDFAANGDATLKTVTVSEFFMDETEITNAEYKEFVKYVRDSVVRSLLGEKVDLMGGKASEEGIGQYAFKKFSSNEEEGAELSVYDEYLKVSSIDKNVDDIELKRLNWNVPIIWKESDYPDIDYAVVLESLYYQPEERYNDKKQLDYRKFIYQYKWLDRDAMKSGKDRSAILKKEAVPVYPDTTAWVKDFAFAYNDPMHDEYFWHIAYNSYPVVGVTWEQATAFCNYRTRRFSSSKKKNARFTEFRLPTEAEWEFAARGGLENAPYPWGGPYLMEGNCFLANFKPKRGDYIEDPKSGNYIYTAKVKSFKPNGYGLFDMAGNVSEWTQTPYYSSTYSVVPSSNPYVGRSGKNPMKVIRGGSWKDVSYQLMVSSRDYEHKDTARSYIGFRCVQAIPEGSTVKSSKKGM
jgi:formylglycine-generating enzyme